MRIDFQFRNLDSGERRFREHAEPRLERLPQFHDRLQGLKITISAQRNWRTVDITADVNGTLLRAEERSDDPLIAFDRAVERIERQLRRLKERVRNFNHESLRVLAAEQAAADLFADQGEPAEGEAPAEIESEAEGIRIVRTKTHSLKPMAPEEACLQMELLGHDFYVFVDGDTQRVGVVYRRHAGGYGLIEPEAEVEA